MDVEISTAKQVDSNSGNGIKKFHIVSRELEKFDSKHHHIVIKLPVTYSANGNFICGYVYNRVGCSRI